MVVDVRRLVWTRARVPAWNWSLRTVARRRAPGTGQVVCEYMLSRWYPNVHGDANVDSVYSASGTLGD